MVKRQPARGHTDQPNLHAPAWKTSQVMSISHCSKTDAVHELSFTKVCSLRTDVFDALLSFNHSRSA